MMRALVLSLVVGMLAGLAVAKDTITIKFATCWWLEPGCKEFLEEMAQRFEEEYGIHVEPVAIPYRDYGPKMKVLFAGRTAPDVFYMRDIELVLWYKSGWLAPIDEYIDLDEYKDVISMWNIQQRAKLDGQRYYALLSEACPYNALIYHEDMFKEAGIEVPKTPEELYEAAKKLSNPPERYGFITAVRPANPVYIMQEAMPIIHGFGGIICKEGTFYIDSPQFAEGVEFWLKLARLAPSGMDYTTQRKLFWNGKAAMCIDGGYFIPWCLSSNPEASKDLNAAVLPFPTRWSPLDITWFGIASQADEEHRKAAAKFLEYWMTDWVQQRWQTFKVYPITTTKGLTEEFKEEHPWYKAFFETAPFAINMTIEGYEECSEEIWTHIGRRLGEILVENLPVRETLAQVQKEVEEIASRCR